MYEDFKKIGKLLFAEGLVHACSGNMSIREGDKIFITKKDSMLGDLQKDDIIEVGMEKGEGDELASSEIPTHRAIYKQTSAQVIIHAHPVNAVAISITDNKIVPQDAEGLFLYKAASIVRVRNSIGSEETARLLPAFLSGDSGVAVIKSHGSFATGKNLEEAYKLTSSLENSCKVIIAVRASGGKPAPRKEHRESRQRPRHGQGAIPPGLGVMDRSRERSRYRGR
jgi:L-fuculose-phosphate aldolase